MDVHMPGMDGLEATRRIKAAAGGRETVIVALTASALDDDRRIASSRTGADDFLAKPCREEGLARKYFKAHLNISCEYEDAEREPGRRSGRDGRPEKLAPFAGSDCWRNSVARSERQERYRTR